MTDLAPLMTWLASLGPYGYLLSAAVPVVAFLLRNRFGPLTQPVTPTPSPSPAVTSPRLDARAPLLNLLLNALGVVPRGRPATIADVPHETHLQLQSELDGVAAAKVAAHTAALADLSPTPPTSTTAPR